MVVLSGPCRFEWATKVDPALVLADGERVRLLGLAPRATSRRSVFEALQWPEPPAGHAHLIESA